MAYQELLQEDHKYLSKEYCTGYTDDYGKWNTGFYCPQYGSKTAVFCCGTTAFKYCCTNKEPVDLSVSGPILLDGDDPNFDGGGPHHGVSSAVFVRVPIVFGVVCGIAAVLILLIVAGCYFCSCCFAYKKRRNDLLHADPRHHHLHLNHHPAGGLYRSTTGTNSTASSNVLNLYSPATTGPLVTTPLDLDWASSLASTYQSQQQLYHPPPQQLAGIHHPHPITPAFAAALNNQRVTTSPATSSLLYNPSSTSTSGIGSAGTSSGAPSVISASLTNSRLPYQNFLNTSTSTLSSTSGHQHRQNTPGGAQQLHRGNLPQQISTTASIVNSYLASLQQVQSQMQQSQAPPMPMTTTTEANVPVPPPPIPNLPPERTRHPSPPPSYFQTVSSASYNGNGGSSGGANRNSRSNSNNSASRGNSGSNRMATIQSILAGSNYYATGNFNWSNEDDLLLADFLLRHENTLRRTLGLTSSSSNNRNNNNNQNSSNNTTNTTNSNNSRNRANPLLSQRELIDLLLRLTCNTNSSSSINSRSDSRAGSETNSTASSVATTRSTVSSSSSSNGALHHPHHHHNHHHNLHSNSKIPSNNSNSTSTLGASTKLTINEVDEDLDEVVSSSAPVSSTTAATTITAAPGMNNSKSSLDLTLSRLSVENDSGVASSGCSTAGSEHAEGLIGSIKAISRDLSEEALRPKKQHAVDDDDDHHHPNPNDGNGGLKIKMCEQQLAATIHPEVNCSSGGGVGSQPNSGEEKEISDHHHHRENSTTTTPPAPKSDHVHVHDAPTVIVHGSSVLPVHVVKAGESNNTAAQV